MTGTGELTVGKQEARVRDRQRAEILLRRAHLPCHPEVGWEWQVAMLAKVLHHHDPFASDHGRFLAAALQARTRKERRAGPRPAAEHAVRYLVTRGEPPWPRAVAAAVERQQAHEQARARQQARLTPTADRDGPAAAQAVVDHWRDHDRQPSPYQLGRVLGWPSHDVWALIHLLVEAGWLDLHRGTLRPGHRARHQPATLPAAASGGP
jgi:hypothetical protein